MKQGHNSKPVYPVQCGRVTILNLFICTMQQGGDPKPVYCTVQHSQDMVMKSTMTVV